MAVSEMALPIKRNNSILSRHALGVVGMICAPALYFGSMFFSPNADAPNPNQIFASLGGILYLSGALASAVAMRRLRVTGNGRAAGILFAVQIVGLLLAMMFDVFEYAAPHLKDSTMYFITDMAYPFSHLLMLVVGIAVVRAGVWQSWRRIPPFLIGFPLIAFLAASALLGRENTGWIFIVSVTLGFFLLGFSVLTTEKEKKLSTQIN